MKANLFPRFAESVGGLIESLRFLAQSLSKLGLRRGWSYWKAYRACQENPENLVDWEIACRSESSRIKEENPQLSLYLEEWADHLAHTLSRLKQIYTWEAMRMGDSDPELARILEERANRLGDSSLAN